MNINIVDVFNKKNEYEKKYNELLLQFKTNANIVVSVTNGIYQIENSIRANKISLKDYILNSDLCNILKDKNIKNYSKNDLKKYMEMYSKQNSSAIYPYKLSLDLYELLEELENIENEKINFEIDSMKKICKQVDKIYFLNRNDLKNLYDSIIADIKSKNYDKNSLDYLTIIINDIFTFFFSGHKKIV